MQPAGAGKPIRADPTTVTFHGNIKYWESIKYLDENNLTDVARLTLKYYDKAYSYTYNKKTTQQIIPVVLDTMNFEENTLKLKRVIKSLDIYNAN